MDFVNTVIQGKEMTEVKTQINNIPPYTRRYVVVRLVNNELWYYATYDEKERAEDVAREIDGFVAEII